MTDFEKYVLARWCYSIGDSFIDDAEYNILDATMKKLLPDNEYCNRSWSSDPCPADLLRKYKMERYIHKVILTDKTESIPSLNSYLAIRSILGDIEDGTLSFKLDGWNTQLSYIDGKRKLIQTRGRSSDALVINHMLDRFPETIPLKGKVTVIMECTVPNDVFDFCKKEFGNETQRGAVRTLLAKPEYSNLLSFEAFDIKADSKIDNIFTTLASWGFNTPTWRYVKSCDELLDAVKEMSELKYNYNRPTDGLVYKGNLTRAIRVDAWEEPIYKSFVLTEEMADKMFYKSPYEETYGLHRIGVKALIYPIKRAGGTQRRISLTNLQRIIDLNLQPGAPIAFRIASSAIADIDENATRLLHQQVAGNWEGYRKSIIEEERLRCLA